MAMLLGERVALRTTTLDDRPVLLTIRRTEEVSRWWRGETDEDFHEGRPRDGVFQFTVRSLGSDSIVGMIQYGEEDDPEYRSASIDIYIDPAAHRQGYATDAIRTLRDHLFDEVGHHRLTIDPAVDNTAAIRCYEQAGFRRVGVMRSYERRDDNTWADGLLMDMLVGDRTSRPSHP